MAMYKMDLLICLDWVVFLINNDSKIKKVGLDEMLITFGG
jgi:hypothetical protein